MNEAAKKVAAATPLIFNGYALVANAGLTSVLGFAFWMLASRLFSQEQVGLGAALISSMTMISYLSQMNLNSLLLRFLPLAGASAKYLVLKAYLFVGVLSALVAVAFANGVGSFAEPLDIFRNNHLKMALFVMATVFWSLFALQDAILTGLRRSVLVPAKNFAYSALKITFLLSFAVMMQQNINSIFLAWILPLFPIIIVMNTTIFRNLNSKIGVHSGRDELDLKSLARYLGWDSIGTFSVAVAFGLAPLMVTASAGVAANATYHLAWTLAYSVYLIGRSMGASLIAEGAVNPQRLKSLTSDTLVHSLILISAAVFILFLFAPLIMSIFGSAYIKDGSGILRVLALCCVPWAVTTVYVSAARAQARTKNVAVVQFLTLVLFVIISALLLPPWGALGVAFSWLITHSLVCFGIIGVGIKRGGWAVVIDWSLALGFAAANLYKAFQRFSPKKNFKMETDIQEILEAANLGDCENFAPMVVPNSQSDVTSVILEPRGAEGGSSEAVMRIVLKFAYSGNGMQALRRNAEMLEMLNADYRLNEYQSILPKLQKAEEVAGLQVSIETAVQGMAGLEILNDPKIQAAGALEAIKVMQDLHSATSFNKVIDECWADRWIDHPIKLIMQSTAVFCSGTKRIDAFDTIRSWLRTSMIGREVSLGLGHGDLWAGNIFYSLSELNPISPQVSGLIDWDTARMDAPQGWDAAHLRITLIMQQKRVEMGSVVSDLLREGCWLEDEIARFTKAEIGKMLGNRADPEYQGSMIALAWLHHVAANLSKSDSKAGNRLWTAANVDRVLFAWSEPPAWKRYE